MLILHIGRHKTGTSSLQHFLHANREELKQYGIIYPPPIEAIAAHHGIALALKAGQDVSKYREMLHELQPQKRNVLLSSESFQRVLPRDVRRLCAGHPTSAVVYLREQFSYAWAAYAQLVCAGPETRFFDEALRAYVPKYYTFLIRWQKITKNNLKVRLFERRRLIDGDVISDFCQTVFGLDKNKFVHTPTVNETLGWRAVNFMRRLNEYIAQDPKRAIIKRHMFGALRHIAAAHPELMEKPRFPEGMREQYQELFVEQNKTIAREFLGMGDEPLFDLDWRGDSAWNTHEGLTEQQVDALCSRVPALEQFRDALKVAAAA